MNKIQLKHITTKVSGVTIKATALSFKVIILIVLVTALVVYGYSDLMTWLGVNPLVTIIIGVNAIPVLVFGVLVLFAVWCILASKGVK